MSRASWRRRGDDFCTGMIQESSRPADAQVFSGYPISTVKFPAVHSRTDFILRTPSQWWIMLIFCAVGLAAICARALQTEGPNAPSETRKKNGDHWLRKFQCMGAGFINAIRPEMSSSERGHIPSNYGAIAWLILCVDFFRMNLRIHNQHQKMITPVHTHCG